MARKTAQVAEPEPEDTEDEEAKDYTVYAGKDATATMADFGEWLLAEVYGDEYPGDADSFLDGVRLGGTLRMEFQRSDFNIERREQRAAEREAERAARPTRARKGKEDAEEAEPDETDEAEETPKSTTRPRRASAAKGSTRPASKSGSGPVAKGKTGARRGRQPAAAGAEAPY